MSPDADRFRGGVAVVTGGAGTSAGLGAGLVRAWAAHGMRVAVLDVDGHAADELVGELRAGGVEAVAAAIDVRREESMQAAATMVRDAFGGCNVLCAHVGGAAPGRIDEIELAQWRDALDVGVVGTVATVQAFLPLLRATNGLRRIVLTSSVAALVPGRFQGPYRAAKAAVTSIGETLDRELGPEGIGTTVVFPSGMATEEMLAAVVPGEVDASIELLPEEFRDVARTLAEEFAGDPLDLTTGRDAATPIVDAVLAGRRYVITHGVSAERAHRARLRELDDAFGELAARGHRPTAPSVTTT